MVVENATIILGLGTLFVYYILYRHIKLVGSLVMIGLGFLSWYYSSQLSDTTGFGILGLIIFTIGLFLLIDWLFTRK